MTITRLLLTRKNLPQSASASPTFVRTISIPSGHASGHVYADGCRLHRLLASGEKHPVTDSIRREVRKLGGYVQRTECSFHSWAGVPHGRADILCPGRLETGIIEMKIVSELPAQPRGRDAAQLGGYVHLACHWAAQLRRAWAALIYVDLEAGKLRVVEYRGHDLRELVRTAQEALAA